MFKALLITSILLSNLPSYAQELGDEQVITSVEITKVEVEPTSDFMSTLGGPIGEVTMIIDGLIAIGTKLWPIIDAGRPVIDTSGMAPSISVLPEFKNADPKREFYEMANWSLPRAQSFRVSYKNKFKSEVVGFTYTVYFQFNGNYNSKGKYITNLKIQASNADALWGFKLNASSELIGIANVGTINNPVASAIIQISYTAKSVVNEVRSSQSFYVDGLGKMKMLRK